MIATGKSKKETNWKNTTLKYSDLVEKLSTTTRTRETYAEYKAMTREEQGNVKDVGGFVGGTLKSGHRKAENTQSRTLLTLDLDHITSPNIWAEIEAKLKCGCLIYSTHSHTHEAQRLRLIIPISRPVLPDEYQAITRMIAFDIGIDQFDDTTYQPSRLMFWPSTAADGEYIFKVQDKAWLDPETILNRYTYGWQDVSYWPESSRVVKNIHSAISRQEDPTTKRGIIGAFCRTYSITEAIDKFLSDVYSGNEDTKRYTFIDGTTSGGVVVYDDDKFSYSNHGTDPASMMLCNSYDLVRIHKFGHLTDKKSNAAMSDLASHDPDVKMQMGQDLLEKSHEDFTVVEADSPSSWLHELTYTDAGKLRCEIKNYRLIIENHAALKGKIARDEFSHRDMVLGSMPWDPRTAVREWTDDDDHGLREFLGSYYPDPKNMYMPAISLAFKNHSYHPIKDYFENLTWDGVKRVDNLMIDYFGCADVEYNKFTIRKWLVAGVTRIYKPGTKFDEMIILSGEADLGKSSFFSNLTGQKWFTASLKTFDDKTVMECMAGKFVVEFGELDAMRKAEVEVIKHFLTKQEFNARLAFGHRATRNPIQWLYAGTTNSSEFLKDKTGNRRFWPIDVFKGSKDIWTDLIEERDQIWAEAVRLYNAGENINLTAAEKLLAAAAQESHREIDELEQILNDRMAWDAPMNQWHDYKHTDIVSGLNLDSKLRGYAKQNLKAILKKRGIVQKHTEKGSVYKIPPIIMTTQISDFEPIQ